MNGPLDRLRANKDGDDVVGQEAVDGARASAGLGSSADGVDWTLSRLVVLAILQGTHRSVGVRVVTLGSLAIQVLKEEEVGFEGQ